MSERPELWKTVRWLGVLVTLVVLGWLGTRLMDQSVGGAVSGLERVLGAITGSTTHIVEGRAEITSTAEISELALIELEMEATRTFENEAYHFKFLPAGTKRLIAKGKFRVTAGYKLEPGVSLKMENGVPVARFPDPEILSVELKDFQHLDERDGWANHLTGADRDQLIKDLTIQMRQQASRSGVLEIVESTLRTRLKDLLGTGDVKIERSEKKKPESAKLENLKP